LQTLSIVLTVDPSSIVCCVKSISGAGRFSDTPFMALSLLAFWSRVLSMTMDYQFVSIRMKTMMDFEISLLLSGTSGQQAYGIARLSFVSIEAAKEKGATDTNQLCRFRT